VCMCVHERERERERERNSVNPSVASVFARQSVSVCVCESLPGALWALQQRELEDTDRGNRGRGLTQAAEARRSLPCPTLSRLVAFSPSKSLPIPFSSHFSFQHERTRAHTHTHTLKLQATKEAGARGWSG